MDLQRLETEVKKATQLIDDAESRTEVFERAEGEVSAEEVVKQTDTIIDLLEEAQQLLLEAEADGLPDQEDPAEQGDGEEEPGEAEPELSEADAQPFDFTVSMQELEHRSRLIEARAYRRAADRIGPPITTPGTASEEQDNMLNSAAVALEAGLGTKPDPETLVALLELRVLQLEIKKARYLAELLIRLDEDGEFGARGREWLERFDTDKSLRDRGRCFIATAACGANDAPDVLALRRFRDDVLAHHAAGRGAIRLYYRVSPPAARFIEDRPTLARWVRRGLIKPAARLVRHV